MIPGEGKYALAHGYVHRPGCAKANPMPGDGGYIDASAGLEYASGLGYQPCADCFGDPEDVGSTSSQDPKGHATHQGKRDQQVRRPPGRK